MKKMSFTIATVVIVLGSLTVTAAAQNRVLGRTDIPFSFAARDQRFNAGTYELRQISTQIICLQDVATGQGVTLLSPQTIVDLPLPKSNSVLYRCWALLLHETACRRQKTLRGSPRSLLVCLVIEPITSSRGFPLDAQPQFLATATRGLPPASPAHTPAVTETASAPH